MCVRAEDVAAQPPDQSAVLDSSDLHTDDDAVLDLSRLEPESASFLADLAVTAYEEENDRRRTPDTKSGLLMGLVSTLIALPAAALVKPPGAVATFSTQSPLYWLV